MPRDLHSFPTRRSSDLATKMAMDGGAKVAHAPSIEIGLAALRAGKGADLLLVDVMMDIAGLIAGLEAERIAIPVVDRKSTRLNSSHVRISYAVFCLKKK